MYLVPCKREVKTGVEQDEEIGVKWFVKLRRSLTRREVHIKLQPSTVQEPQLSLRNLIIALVFNIVSKFFPHSGGAGINFSIVYSFFCDSLGNKKD